MTISHKIYQNYQKNDHHLIQITGYGVISDDDFLKFKKILSHYLMKRQKISLIIDMREVNSIPIKLVRPQAEFMRRYEKYAKQYIKSSVILTSSTFNRVALNLLFSLKRPVSPNLVTESHQKCLNFIDMHLY